MNELEDTPEFEEVDTEAGSEAVIPSPLSAEPEALPSIPLEQHTDESIPQELIDEMKLLGMDKPPNITWARWIATKHPDRSINQLILHLHVSGYNYREIAEEVGYTQQQIMYTIRSPAVQDRIKALRSEVYGDNFKKALSDRMSKAVGVLDDILDNPEVRPQVRLQAAQFIADHAVGKPTQTIEHKGGLLAEFIAKTDQQLREAGSTDIELHNRDADIDNMLKDTIPKGTIVGKRG